jgi:hypothetical protein
MNFREGQHAARNENSFLALFSPGNSAEFQQKAFLISVAFFLKT